jgi:hypothetical protein
LKKELDTKSNDNGKRDMKSAGFEHEMELRDRKIEKLNDILESKDNILREIEDKIRKSGGEGLA